MAVWVPRSVEELENAVRANVITESHYLDCKAFTNSGGVSRSAAKCVASLAVDGGVLLLGVGEDKPNRRFVLEPMPLKGLRDTIDSMVANSVSPSLRVTVDCLDRGDGTGYLVVVVPASTRAPHMVDGRYYGRSDTAAEPLSDPEIRRLWSRNADRHIDRAALLAAEVSREPVPGDERQGARLFVIGQPMSADPTLLLDSCDGRDLLKWPLQPSQSSVLTAERSYGTHLGGWRDAHRRARGVALSSGHLDSDRTVSGELQSPRNIVDLEIWESGGIRLYYGCASGVIRGADYLDLGAIAGETSGVIELARRVALTAEFNGSWQFGVAIRGAKSLPSYSHLLSGEAHWKYSEDGYDETVEVDHATLFSVGSPILKELLGRFLRAAFAYNAGIDQLDIYPQPTTAA